MEELEGRRISLKAGVRKSRGTTFSWEEGLGAYRGPSLFPTAFKLNAGDRAQGLCKFPFLVSGGFWRQQRGVT
ncbi:hypothetical protein FKM82_024655 [Ascaphus truei]